MNHPAISELIKYVESAAQTRDYFWWGENLSLLDVHGLGDLPPAEFVSKLPYEIDGDFHCAVEYLTEISMSVHNGRVTRQPQVFLGKLLNIVTKHGISLPNLDVFVQKNGRGSLGPWIDDQTLQIWRVAMSVSSDR